MLVYVVGFQPATDNGGVGGFDWYFQADLAGLRLKALAEEVAVHPHLARYSSVTFVPLDVPEELVSESLTDADTQPITDWIDSNLHLVEVARPKENT